MYIWLVLSTFLAILAGYSLPMRSDAAKMTDIPVASAYMLKMQVKHSIAKEYVKSLKWPFYCDEEPLDGFCPPGRRINYSKYANAIKIYVEDSNVRSFVQSVFDSDELIAEYDNYVSQIFCLDGDACSEGELHYLITYGDLHEKWLAFGNEISESGPDVNANVTPADDFLRSLKLYFPAEEMFGYVVDGADGKGDVINHSGSIVVELPAAVYDEMKESGNCNKKYNGACIVHVNKI